MISLKDRPVRVLYVHGGKLNYGGTEAYMMNYYRHFDRTRLQVDFAVHGFERGVYEDEIEAMGGQVFYLPVKSRDYFGNIRALQKLFQSGRYEIVHAHMDAMNAVVLKQAKKCGIPVRISHSHNTQHQTQNCLKLMLNDFEKKQVSHYATELLTCSEAAGKWLYGDKPFTVLHNAIDAEQYRFSPQTREAVRESLGLRDRFVVGHVGRFHFQKNHEFLLEIFRCLHREHPQAALLLVGDGELRTRLEEKIKAYGLTDDVILTGNRSDVASLLQAMDVFLFPSLFEGLGIVLIEAQAAGLPSVASSEVPAEADLTDTVRYLGLEQSPDVWAQAVWDAGKAVREDRCDDVKAAGYDITEQARRLEEFYLTRLEQLC